MEGVNWAITGRKITVKSEQVVLCASMLENTGCLGARVLIKISLDSGWCTQEYVLKPSSI